MIVCSVSVHQDPDHTTSMFVLKYFRNPVTLLIRHFNQIKCHEIVVFILILMLVTFATVCSRRTIQTITMLLLSFASSGHVVYNDFLYNVCRAAVGSKTFSI